MHRGVSGVPDWPSPVVMHRLRGLPSPGMWGFVSRAKWSDGSKVLRPVMDTTFAALLMLPDKLVTVRLAASPRAA